MEGKLNASRTTPLVYLKQLTIPWSFNQNPNRNRTN